MIYLHLTSEQHSWEQIPDPKVPEMGLRSAEIARICPNFKILDTASIVQL